MKRQIFPTASKYRRRSRHEFGGETVEYIIVILAVVVIGGGRKDVSAIYNRQE
mgnify:CR=1 FL=1